MNISDLFKREEEEPQKLQNLRLQERHLENKIKAWELLDWGARSTLSQISLTRLKAQLDRVNLEIIKLL